MEKASKLLLGKAFTSSCFVGKGLGVACGKAFSVLVGKACKLLRPLNCLWHHEGSIMPLITMLPTKYTATISSTSELANAQQPFLKVAASAAQGPVVQPIAVAPSALHIQHGI